MRIRDKEKQKEYSRRHYAKNREKMVKRAILCKAQQKEKVKAIIEQYKLDNPCIDCGEDDPIVLEFDHRADKEFNIADGVLRGLALSRIMTEISKCDVRCANCHRRKTHYARTSLWK